MKYKVTHIYHLTDGGKGELDRRMKTGQFVSELAALETMKAEAEQKGWYTYGWFSTQILKK